MRRKWLTEERKKLGLSQREIAPAAGISAPSYCSIETGKTNPRIEHAKKLAEILKVDFLKFYEDR